MRLACRTFFAFLLIFFLVLRGTFVLPSVVLAAASTAATKIGTHLIQGNEGGQKQVLDMLRGKGLASGSYPVVVMIDPKSGSGVSLLTETGFSPIARVNIDCGTTTADLITLAGNIPAGIPVTIGNEINNQNPTNGEWKCDYSIYATLFNAFADAWANKGPLGISTMDTINGDYDAAITLQKILDRRDLKKNEITAVFANIYETSACKYEADRCNTKAGQWVLTQFAKYGISAKPLYITEFGTTKCTDYDCIQSFYEQHNDIDAKAVVGFTRPPGQDSGISWVHTVPGVCEYWEGGSLAVKKPSRCGASQTASGSFVYPGIDDQIGAVAMQKMAASYTMTCGSQINLEGKIVEEEKFNEPDKKDTNGNYLYDNSLIPPSNPCPDGDRCKFTVSGSVWLNFEQTTIPLFRLQNALVPNPDDETRRMTDLEGFFSSTYTKKALTDKASLLHPLVNGVSKKLIDESSQCKLKLEYLETIKQLCATYWKNRPIAPVNGTPLPVVNYSEKCPLDLTIPTSGFSYLSILSQKPNGFSCDKQDAPTSWLQALHDMEMTLPKAFKPAYLVHYATYPEKELPENARKKVSWLLPDGDKKTKKERLQTRIHIEKLYVPAGFAETKPIPAPEEPHQFFPKFESGFMQTMRSLVGFETQEQIQTTQNATQTELYSRMRRGDVVNPNPFVGAYIDCYECEKSPDSTQLEDILVRRINAAVFPKVLSGRNQSCVDQDLIGETASVINQSVNPPGNPDPLREVEVVAQAKLVANGDPGSGLQIRTYLLLPEEYRNIEDYQDFLRTTFMGYDELQAGKTVFVEKESQTVAAGKEKAYKYLQLADTAPKAGNSGKTIHISSPKNEDPNNVIGYKYQYNADGTYNPEGQRVIPAGLIVGPNLDTFNVNPQVPGGVLAHGLWNIMCNVLRPYEEGKPTIPYPGFEKFLQQGPAACTGGTKDTPSPTIPPSSGSQVACAYPNDAINAAIQNAAKKYNIPSEMLLAIFQMEGLDYRKNPEKYICKENSPKIQAVGVMQLRPSAYNLVTCPDERMSNDLISCQADPGKLSRCDVNTAFELATRLLLQKVGHWLYGVCDGTKRNTAGISVNNINEIYLASSYYYGSCKPDTLTINYASGALARGEIAACRDGDCTLMGYGDFVCAFMAKQNGKDYCNRPNNFPSQAQCKF